MKCITSLIIFTVAAHCAYLPPPSPVCILPITSGLHQGPYGPTLIQSNDHHSWTQAQAAASSSPWVHNNHPVGSPVLSPPPTKPSATFQDHQSGHQHRPAAMYLAANPGAVHKAPLPGHTVNQQSLNLAPAPGTGY